MTPPRLYGILDCAADPALHEHAARLEPEHAACLYMGKIDPLVRAVSPYLVELAPDDPLSRRWRAEGWGKAWGLLISSRADLATVRRRLRHFTMARLPSGEGPVLFRFWDPRVFRVYLPLVEPEAIGEWFKDIDLYVAETEDGAGSLRFSLANGALQVERGVRPAG